MTDKLNGQKYENTKKSGNNKCVHCGLLFIDSICFIPYQFQSYFENLSELDIIFDSDT